MADTGSPGTAMPALRDYVVVVGRRFTAAVPAADPADRDQLLAACEQRSLPVLHLRLHPSSAAALTEARA